MGYLYLIIISILGLCFFPVAFYVFMKAGKVLIYEPEEMEELEESELKDR